MSRVRNLLAGLGLAASLLVLPTASLAQTSASPYTTGYRFDTLRRIVGIISPDPDGSGPIGFPAVRYTYDADGDLIKTETGFLSAWQSEAVAPSSWAGFTIKTTKALNLDAMGNPTQTLTSGASGQTLALTQTAYDADDRAVCSVVRMNLATTATDACALGAEGAYGPDRVTSTHYDGDGHVDYIKRAVGISGLEQFYARYTYTNNGQKQNETDANGNTTQYGYDGYDRLTSVYYPSKTTGSGTIDTADYEAYGYDASDNRTSYRRRNGQTYGYGYDALNRQTLKTRSDNANLNVSSGYDLLGHLIRAQFADGSMSLVNSYDAVGRQLTASETIGATSRTLSYHYDQGSLRDILTFPDGVQQRYQYNVGNQLTWTGLPDASVGYAPNYDGYDRVNGIARANSANTSLGYDDIDRVTSLVHSFANSSRNVGWTFSYNPASQLMTATTTNTDYDYVETSSQPDNRTFNGLNQDATIAAVNGGTGYDANGNMHNDGSRQFSYDIDNHVTGMTGPATSGYLYDPIGRLAQETVNGLVTQFLYDGTNLVAEYDSSGTLERRYMHALGTDQPWVQFTGSSAGSSTAKYLYANYQGSVIALADGSGTVADADIYKYGPYGEPLDLNNNPSTSGFRFRYTGQTLMDGTGLYYYKARVYDPVTGRFLQTDPIGSKDDLNLYAYAEDNPVNKADSTGMAPPPEADEPPPPTENGPETTSEYISEARIRSAEQRARDAGAPIPPRIGPPSPEAAEQAEAESEAAIRSKQGEGSSNSPDPRQFLNEQRAKSGLQWGMKSPQNRGEDGQPNPPDIEDFGSENHPEGWIWKGKQPEGGHREGAWNNPETGESFHDDRSHPEGKPPHVTYTDPDGQRWDNFGDGWKRQSK